MLPLINALSTDPIDLSSGSPSTTAHGLDNVELQATFGDLMVSSMPVAPPSTMTLADETLPPGGNSLPVNKPVVNMLPAGTEAIDGSVLTMDEQDESGDLLAVTAPENELLMDTTDNGESETVPVVQGFLNPGTRRQVEDLPPSGRMRERMQQPVIPGNVRIFDSQPGIANGEHSANQQADNTARLVFPDRPMVAETMDATKQAIDAAAAIQRAVVEKFELAPKSTSLSAPQATVVAADSISPLQGATPNSRVIAPPAIQAVIDVPVLDDAWGDALNERVLWMAGKSIQRAEIRLNPADLGPIRVEVSVIDDAAKVSFSAQNAATREAIESAIPRLRDMLSENGLSLANTDVSDSGVQQEQQASDQDALHGPSAEAESLADGETAATSSLQSRSTSALVDTFV